MKSKKAVILISVVVIVLIAAIAVWYIAVQRPHNAAAAEYNKVVSVIKDKNKELDTSVKKLKKLVSSDKKALDETISETAKETIKTALSEKVTIPEMPKKTADILAKAKELDKPVDYTEILKKLNDTYVTYNNSIKQYEQLTNPSEEFVLQRISSIDEVGAVSAVTEDQDPNGKLHKSGGYTATIYFESKNVNQDDIYVSGDYADVLIDKGTDAGGAVEVYATEKDAKARNEYLSAFDGGLLSSGSHRVAGTVVIRTSSKLTATNQNALEAKVLAALTELK